MIKKLNQFNRWFDDSKEPKRFTYFILFMVGVSLTAGLSFYLYIFLIWIAIIIRLIGHGENQET